MVKNHIIIAEEVSIHNDVGGTELVQGPFHVKVIREWGDYETGGHLEGRLFREEDIAKTFETGTTGVKLSAYPKESELYKEAKEARDNFDPSIVFVSEFEVLEIKGPNPDGETECICEGSYDPNCPLEEHQRAHKRMQRLLA